MKEKNKDNENNLSQATSLLGGLVGGRIGKEVLTDPTTKALHHLFGGLNKLPDRVTRKDKKELKKLLKIKGLDISHNRLIPINNAYYRPNILREKLPNFLKNIFGRDTVVTLGNTRNAGTVAHELGHANIERNKGLVRWMQRNLYGKHKKITHGLGLSAAILSNLDEEDPLKAALKGAGFGALSHAGTLVPEFEASRRGIGALMRTSLTPKQKILNSLLLAPAFGTYAARATLPSALAGLAATLPRKIINKFDKKKEKKAGELLHGGLGDNQPDARYDKKELSKGVKHEQEHTSDESMAKEIAKDHLEENDSYYTDLDKAKLGGLGSLMNLLD